MTVSTPDRNDILSQRGRTNALKRYRAEDDPELITARRDLAAASLAAYVQRVVDAAPELTPAQRDAIAALLRPQAGAA